MSGGKTRPRKFCTLFGVKCKVRTKVKVMVFDISSSVKPTFCVTREKRTNIGVNAIVYTSEYCDLWARSDSQPIFVNKPFNGTYGNPSFTYSYYLWLLWI